MTEVPPRPVPAPRPGNVPSTGGVPGTGSVGRAPEQLAGPPTTGAVPGPVPDRTDRALATIDVALRPLDTLAGRPVVEHPAVFEAVHEALQRTLAESDS